MELKDQGPVGGGDEEIGEEGKAVNKEVDDNDTESGAQAPQVWLQATEPEGPEGSAGASRGAAGREVRPQVSSAISHTGSYSRLPVLSGVDDSCSE